VLREAGLFDLTRLIALPTASLAWPSVLAPLVLFGGLYWWTALGIENPRSLRSTSAQLGLLTLVAAFLSLDCVYLVACLAAVLFPPRAAFVWLAAQVGSVCFVLAAAHTLGMGVELAADPSLSRPLALAVDMVHLLVWQVVAFTIGYVCSEEVRQRRELAQVNAELLATRQLLTEASRIAERARVSSTIDERLGSHLAGLAMILELATRTVEGKALASVREARSLVRALLGDVRHFAQALGSHRPLDLARALRLLTAGGVRPRVHLDLPDDLRLSDPQRAHTLFRCAQEAVTNAVKHSGASNLWLQITREPGATVLQARDDGRGAQAAAAGNGLTGMRERVEALAGSVEIATSTGAGFCLRVVVPDG
jgi:signal transduction histidine kinase